MDMDITYRKRKLSNLSWVLRVVRVVISGTFLVVSFYMALDWGFNFNGFCKLG
jgi:hypothetical protein